MEQLLDTELVKRAQNGEGQAFDILVSRYQGKVTSLVYRYVNNSETALDLVQDIFFKIYRNLVHFKGDAKFSSWLYRVASNESIDHLRRKKVRKEQSLDHIQDAGVDFADLSTGSDTAQCYETDQERIQVRKALAQLPMNLQTVVVMKVFQEMTFDEIAEVLQEPVSTVKSRLYKALSSLGGIMRQTNFIERGKR